MPTTANGIELSNGTSAGGRIVDPISLEEINKEPGKSLILGTYAFNTDTIYELFKGTIDNRINNINFDMAEWDGFEDHVRELNIFNDQGGPLRFIDIEAEGVLDDLKQLYLSFGGGAGNGDNIYNTRSRTNDVGVIKPISWSAALKPKNTKRKPKNTKRKPKNTKRKPKNTKRNPKNTKRKPKKPKKPKRRGN